MDTLATPSITKSIKVFRFDPHPRRKQLTIVGETCISVARSGKVVTELTEPLKKVVKLVGLTHFSRSEAIVRDIVQSCSFIEGARLISLLKKSIDELHKREYDGNGIAILTHTAADGSYLPRYLEVFDEVDNRGSARALTAKPMECVESDIRNLNHYVELLYEDLDSKVESVRLISSLTKCNRYLIQVSEHASASNAIFRTLREDSSRSLNLTFHIFSICLDFAKLHCFHRFLIRHKLPQLILDILDFELERCEKWKAQLLKHEELAMAKSSSKAMEDYVAANENFKCHLGLQNKILQLGFDILHYLSEDKTVAIWLLHQGIVTSLTDALDRPEFTLWECVISFLKDMAAFKECIEQIINVDTLAKLTTILKGKSGIPVKVARPCFSLICNLSLNGHLKDEIIRMDLTSVLGKCLSKSSLSDTIAKTLYLLSTNPSNREPIVESGVVEILLGQLTVDKDSMEQVPKIKGALAVNLAKDPNGAAIMGNSIKVAALLKQSIKTHDTLGMKIIRNIAETRPSPVIDQQAGHIAKAVVEVNSLDFALECVGILGHVNVNSVNFPELLQKNRLVVWLKRQILNYMSMTNIASLSGRLKTATLEVIMLLSNVSKTEAGARFVVSEGFVDQILSRLLFEPHTDVQLVQQIVYLFNVCCRHEAVAVCLVTKTQFPREFMAFSMSIGGQLRVQCDNTLHMLSEFDNSWKETMMEHNFLLYNEKWTTAAYEQDKQEKDEVFPGLHRKSNSDLYERLQRAHARDPYFDILQEDEDDPGRPSSCDVTGDTLDDTSSDDEDDYDDDVASFLYSDAFRRSPIFAEENFTKRKDSLLSLYDLYRLQYDEQSALSKEDWNFFLAPK